MNKQAKPGSDWDDQQAQIKDMFLTSTRSSWWGMWIDVTNRHKNCTFVPLIGEEREILNDFFHCVARSLVHLEQAGYHGDNYGNKKVHFTPKQMSHVFFGYFVVKKIRKYTETCVDKDITLPFDLFELQVTETLLNKFMLDEYSHGLTSEEFKNELRNSFLTKQKILSISTETLEHVLTEREC